MHSFEVHSNESACRKSGRLGLEQVLYRCYIGDEKTEGDWIKEHKEKWERDICVLRKMSNKCPQESYAAVAHVVQLEWIFLQCMTKEIAKDFTGLGKVLRETFLPCIFFGN